MRQSSNQPRRAMNNDPIPSYAARQRVPSDGLGNASDNGDGHRDEHGERPADTADTGPSSAAEVAAETPPPTREARRKKRKEGLAKKLQFVNHLQKSLDMLVFAYVCTLYYMECSLTRLLLRVVPHYIFISPKDRLFLLPAHRPHVFAILAPNLICVLFHLILALPQAGEITRGYLHGGLMVDFVGQKPPTWKAGFLVIDVVILVLQCLMLAVYQDLERLRKAVLPSLQTVAEAAAGLSTQADPQSGQGAEAAGTTQDHDAEERGVLRDEQDLTEDEEDAELRPPNAGESEGRRRSGRPPNERVGIGHSQVSGNADLVDVLQSGNGMLGNFHVVHAVRTVGNDYQRAAAYSLQSLGYTATLAAAVAADRRARLTAARQQ